MLAPLVLAANHEASDVLQKQQRRPILVAELDEMRTFQRAVVEQHAIVGEYSYLVAQHACKAADQRLAITRLVFVKAAAVHHARDHLAHIELHPWIPGMMP